MRNAIIIILQRSVSSVTPDKGLLPCFLITQTTIFESAASDKEWWKMSLQPLAVMVTEANQCQNVPFLYTNIKRCSTPSFFSSYPRCDQIMKYFIRVFLDTLTYFAVIFNSSTTKQITLLWDATVWESKLKKKVSFLVSMKDSIQLC